MADTILIIPFPYLGPINSSFKMAQILQNNGFIIIYVSPIEFKSYIVNQGFEVKTYDDKGNHHNEGTVFNTIKKYYIRSKFRDRMLQLYSNEIIEIYMPKLVLVDSDVPRYAAGLRNKVKVIMYSTTLTNNKEKYLPPYFSTYIPNKTIKNERKVNLLWYIWLVKKRFYFFKHEVLSFGNYDHNLKRYFRRLKMDQSKLNQKRAWPTGFYDLKEIFFYPKQFDFNLKNENNNNYYVGPLVNLKRIFTDNFDWNTIQSDKFLICCSMGSLANFYNSQIDQLYFILADLTKKRKDFCVIIAAGDSYDKLIKSISPNFHVFKSLPLIEVLDKTDIFINHAGTNSVKEAILKKVPMLLIPLSKQNDQNGVAARCEYFGVAKHISFRNLNLHTLEQNIDEIITNYQAFNQKLDELYSIFQLDTEEQDLMDIIQREIN
jgi:UDP:flavonoid glycosyltransferase YjiC (YdhE family)